MLIYPQIYLDNVTKITIDFLKENGIKALILDIDNTLLDFDKNLLQGAEEWCNNLKGQGIKFYILSNTNKKEKVEMVSKRLDIPYIMFAKKPLKKGFIKAKQALNLEESQIAVAGDQIFTDVIGANRSKMFSILTKPIDKRDILMTRIKRPLEDALIRRYLKKNRREN
ncbi:MAG: YqeG family HAD IIIA-type phosphatase [Clostridia bacterium]|nr:YqeG family HAD IIIA-type phosphatase [Clostridia bacterium]